MFDWRKAIAYESLTSIKDPVVVAKGLNANYGDVVVVELQEGRRRGQVIGIHEDIYYIQVFEGTEGMSEEARIRNTFKPITIEVSELMLGRVLSGLGEPKDGKPPIKAGKEKDINGLILSPYYREVPHELIETGITSIDLLNTLVKGQKIAMFASPGLAVLELQMQILEQSILNSSKNFAVVFAGIGLSHDEEHYIFEQIENSGIGERSILFLNSDKDPSMEALLTPRIALTAAEYLAHERGYDVLVLMGDITNYANVLRNLASQKGELTVREGYPSYLFTDLASIYERCGTLQGRKGSITQMPFLTMPNDDITHPVPDTTGYISEGQYILTRDMLNKGVNPPMDILNSLSRMMHFAVTLEQDKVSKQVYHTYAEGKKFQDIANMIGMDVLDEQAKKFVRIKEEMDESLLSQGKDENRTLKQSIAIAKEILKKAA